MRQQGPAVFVGWAQLKKQLLGRAGQLHQRLFGTRPLRVHALAKGLRAQVLGVEGLQQRPGHGTGLAGFKHGPAPAGNHGPVHGRPLSQVSTKQTQLRDPGRNGDVGQHDAQGLVLATEHAIDRVQQNQQVGPLVGPPLTIGFAVADANNQVVVLHLVQKEQLPGLGVEQVGQPPVGRVALRPGQKKRHPAILRGRGTTTG